MVYESPRRVLPWNKIVFPTGNTQKTHRNCFEKCQAILKLDGFDKKSNKKVPNILDMFHFNYIFNKF